MTFLDWTLVSILAFLVFYGLGKAKSNQRRGENVSDPLSQLKDFEPSCTLIGRDGFSALAIDENRKQICLFEQSVSPDHPKISLRNIPYHMLLRSEIVEDGATVTHTSRRDQLGGVALGDAILKSTGEVIGRLSAQTGLLTKAGLLLRLIIKDTDHPIHRIVMLDPQHPIDQAMYKAAYKLTEQWHGRLSVIIHECQEPLPMNGAGKNSGVAAQQSSANESAQLAALLKKDLGTSTEFDLAKERVLKTT